MWGFVIGTLIGLGACIYLERLGKKNIISL